MLSSSLSNYLFSCAESIKPIHGDLISVIVVFQLQMFYSGFSHVCSSLPIISIFLFNFLDILIKCEVVVVKLYHKGLYTEYFQLWRTYGFCCNCCNNLTLLFQHENDYKHYVNKWAWLFSNKVYLQVEEAAWICPTGHSLWRHILKPVSDNFNICGSPISLFLLYVFFYCIWLFIVIFWPSCFWWVIWYCI